MRGLPLIEAQHAQPRAHSSQSSMHTHILVTTPHRHHLLDSPSYTPLYLDINHLDCRWTALDTALSEHDGDLLSELTTRRPAPSKSTTSHLRAIIASQPNCPHHTTIAIPLSPWQSLPPFPHHPHSSHRHQHQHQHRAASRNPRSI